MAKLSIIEQRSLEELLEMGGGYVLDFSNRTFEEFVLDSVDVDIYEERYNYASGSKANRLRGFWRSEGDKVVGKLINDLVEYAVFVRKDAPSDLVDRCRAIARRLLRLGQQTKESRPTREFVTAGSAISSGPVSAEEYAEARAQQVSSQQVRAFVSYSWDSEEHRDWVRGFADTLLGNGIDTVLDQYDLRLGANMYEFMEFAVRDADAILCVCTPNYVVRANGRSKGVGAETSLITPKFFERVSSGKQFIPLVRSSDNRTPIVPEYLAGLVFVDFRDANSVDARMEELLRHLYNQPRHRKPPKGRVPRFDEAVMGQSPHARR